MALLQQYFISLNKTYVFVWFIAFYYSYFSVESLSVNIIQRKADSVCLGYGWGTLKTVRHLSVFTEKVIIAAVKCSDEY